MEYSESLLIDPAATVEQETYTVSNPRRRLNAATRNHRRDGPGNKRGRCPSPSVNGKSGGRVFMAAIGLVIAVAVIMLVLAIVLPVVGIVLSGVVGLLLLILLALPVLIIIALVLKGLGLPLAHRAYLLPSAPSSEAVRVVMSTVGNALRGVQRSLANLLSRMDRSTCWG